MRGDCIMSLGGIDVDKFDQHVYNPNLLDNWYFVDPVNQRNVNSTISAKGYFIDRWILVEGSVEITKLGLVLNGTIQQKFENSVDIETKATVLTTEGLIDAEYDDTQKVYQITASNQTLIAAKLEVGDSQTLAYYDGEKYVLNDPIPNKSSELCKCLAYYVHEYNVQFHTDDHINSLYYLCNVEFPVPMRATPTLTYRNSGTGNLYRVYTGSAVAATIGLSVDRYRIRNGTRTSGTLTAGDILACIVNLSAEL